jgi:NADP-dependent 3-hydroxy acid dehydrogenase YdfG
LNFQSVSPGVVETEFRVASGLLKPENKVEGYSTVARLQPEDVSNAVMYLLSTPTHVNVTEIIIKPIGEKF